MPMMRRGPLDRYPAEWVLRQANAHQVSGCIEFHTTAPTTFYLEGGRIYAAEHGVGLGELGLGDAAIPDEDDVRRSVIALLTVVLEAQEGWYYHDPLGQHPGRGAWIWETASLLMETRANAHEVQTLAAWTDRRVALQDTPAASVTLGPDAWAVVVSLAGAASASELRSRLGWNPGRLLSALTEIEERGVLAPERRLPPRIVPAPPPTSTTSLATVPSEAAVASRAGGPLSPRPVLPAPPDVRTDLGPKGKRRLASRKPSGS